MTQAARTLAFLLLPLLLAGGCASVSPPTGLPALGGKALSVADEVEAGMLSQLSAPELRARGEAFLAAENLAMARVHFLAAVNREPAASGGYAGLGSVLFRSGQYDGSRELFRQALALAPENPLALAGMGKVARAQGQHEEAIAYFYRALEAAPRDPGLLTELAVTYDLSGKFIVAEPLFVKVTELLPGRAAAYNNLGMNRFLQEKYGEALADFRRALELDPENRRFRNNLALTLAMSGKMEPARRLFDQTVGTAAAANNLGYLHLVRREWGEAARFLAQALEESPRFYERAFANRQALPALAKGETNGI